MHADQNLWTAEQAKVPFTFGIRDPEVGVCAKPGGRPQKTLACRSSDLFPVSISADRERPSC